MDRTRTGIFLGVLVVLLGAGLLAATLSGVASQDPSPESVSGKLDARLGRLLAEQEGRTQTTTWQGDDRSNYAYDAARRRNERSAPLHTDADGREYVNALVKTDGSRDGLEHLGVIVQGTVGTVVVAAIPLDSLGPLTSLPNVEFVEAERQLEPRIDVSVRETGALTYREATGADGSGVIIGIIDSGVDFRHSDFIGPDGATRIVLLCDQTIRPRDGNDGCPGGGGQRGGTLWSGAQINAALDGAGVVSQVDESGHGSHVLGIAAGDDGTFTDMAPGADLIVVKTSFTNTDIVNAIGFIDRKAAEMGLPYVINLSLGGDTGPHDGTDAMSQAIDDLTGEGVPGKVVVAAAGNSGNDKAHASGEITFGATSEVRFRVPSGTTAVYLDIWYDGQEEYTFGLEHGGGNLIGALRGDSLAGCFLSSDTCYWVHHTPQLHMNGDVEIYVELTAAEGSSTLARIHRRRASG